MSRKPKPLTDTPARWKAIYKKYGLTKERYQEILQEQGGVCFICQRSPFEIRKRQWLSVDHCHKTGRIRGLLCYRCNHIILGMTLQDDKELARRLLKYLTRRTKYGYIPT